MIDKGNFKDLLRYLNFKEKGDIFSYDFVKSDAYLKVDFKNRKLIFPTDKGLIVNGEQATGFHQAENFVVFECVYRLFELGYVPDTIELEPKWKVGHGMSGGRADILITDRNEAGKKPLLIIECKTAGREYEKAWTKTLINGGQIFSYAKQDDATRFICLYASSFDKKNAELIRYNKIISIKDNPELLLQENEVEYTYQKAGTAQELFQVWKNTYELHADETGIFEDTAQPYLIGKSVYTLEADTKPITSEDTKSKYHEFRTILRKHNIARKETAFEVLVNLFLCKIVDEQNNSTDLKFYWKGIAYDNYFDFVDRLQSLYKAGMSQFLGEEITYVSSDEIDNAFWAVKNDPDATRKVIQEYFKKLKFYSNGAFSLLNVHNETLFRRNVKVLVELVRMWQTLRLRTYEQNQFLGDMFENFLDNSIKQSEGQFFTPMPICGFVVSALPLEMKIQEKDGPLTAIDYACGSGHFLNEYARQIKAILPDTDDKEKTILPEWYENITGVEKEDRLAKVAKISAFMYSQSQIKIKDQDALADIEGVAAQSQDVLIANPPFAVEGFLSTLTEKERSNYTLTKITGPDSNTNTIQCFFIERAKQLMAPGAVAGIIVPSSVLSNSDGVHTATREIILQYFNIVALTELGSGTFGKTGTNTVVLFLQRKSRKPEPAVQYRNRVNAFFRGKSADSQTNAVYDDFALVKKYCNHIEIPLAEYTKLLQIGQSDYADISDLDSLQAFDVFQDYRADFDKKTSTKNLKKAQAKKLRELPDRLRKSIANVSPKPSEKEIEETFKKELPGKRADLQKKQQTELNRAWVNYLTETEKDKLYYFILANDMPRPVLLVRSPTNNKEQKKFLGYEWSGSKGSEGIRYLNGEVIGNIITPLFNPKYRTDAAKISYAIRKNFTDKPLVDLPENCSYAKAEDLLDFSRKDFDKKISLNPNHNFTIETKWDLVKIGDITKTSSGGTPLSSKNEYYENGDIPWVNSGEVSQTIIYDTKNKINKLGLNNSSAKIFPIDTVLVAMYGATAGQVGILGIEAATNQAVCGLFPSKKYVPLYAYYFLSTQLDNLMAMRAGTARLNLNQDTIQNFKIPLPPLDVQKQIVKACEAVDAEVIIAKQEIKESNQKVNELVSNESQKYTPQRFTNFVEIISGGTPKTGIAEYWNGNIPWLSVADFSNEKRYVESTEKYITKEGLENSSTRYLQADDIIISARGTVGAMAQLKIPMTFNQSCYGLRGDERIDNGYLYYILKQEIKQLQERATGATFGAIIRSTFESIKIPVPPLTEQKALLEKITALEQKIRLAETVINAAADKKAAILDKYLK